MRLSLSATNAFKLVYTAIGLSKSTFGTFLLRSHWSARTARLRIHALLYKTSTLLTGFATTLTSWPYGMTSVILEGA